MKSKKTILILIDWYLPGRKAGGPVKSVESFVWGMKDEFDFKILTTDTDLGDDQPYLAIETNRWLKREDGSEVFYLNKNTLSKYKISDVINSTDHDFLYLNSFYSKWFSIIPLQLRKKGIIKSKIVLAPRGMLSEGALALKKLKKKAFIYFSKFTKLHNDIIWHATYQQEVEEIKKVFGKDSNVRLCSNFSKPLTFTNGQKEKRSGDLKLFFLSRVARVKNLHVALYALKTLDITDGNIVYDIFGAIEDENYKQECVNIINTLSKNISVTFKGEIKNELIPETISKYHFLFLPTSNENFGHSIFESFQCGCPVIISNKTPWRDLEKNNTGWDIEPIALNYTSILKKCCLLNDTEYELMSFAALQLAQEKMDLKGQKEAALLLFS